MICSWRELRKFTMLSEQILWRSVKLYNFPKPNKMVWRGRIVNCWDEEIVLTWMTESPDYLHIKNRLDAIRAARRSNIPIMGIGALIETPDGHVSEDNE